MTGLVIASGWTLINFRCNVINYNDFFEGCEFFCITGIYFNLRVVDITQINIGLRLRGNHKYKINNKSKCRFNLDTQTLTFSAVMDKLSTQHYTPEQSCHYPREVVFYTNYFRILRSFSFSIYPANSPVAKNNFLS